MYRTGAEIDGEVHFVFSSSESLDTVNISLSTGRVASRSSSGTDYDFYLRGFDSGFSGAVGFTVDYSDLWGNTGSISGT